MGNENACFHNLCQESGFRSVSSIFVKLGNEPMIYLFIYFGPGGLRSPSALVVGM